VQKIVSLSVVLLFLSFQVSGQILNIEKFRIDKDTFDVWSGNIGIGFSTKKQQTNITTLNSNSNVVYLSKHHSYMNISYIKFIGVEESDLLSEGYTHFRVNFLRKKFLSYEPFLQLQYDLGRGLLRRELYGFSFRAKLLATPKTLLTFNSGAMYEYELWKGQVIRYARPENPELGETTFIKSTSNIALRGDVAKNLNVLFVTYYQARFERFFVPRVITDIQVNIVISKHFTLSNQFVSTYDALPILFDNQFIFSFTTNLLVKF
jgi:hypothetical protein